MASTEVWAGLPQITSLMSTFAKSVLSPSSTLRVNCTSRRLCDNLQKSREDKEKVGREFEKSEKSLKIQMATSPLNNPLLKLSTIKR